MKIKTTISCASFLMIVLISSQPFVSIAQQNSVEIQAKTDAKQDAETDVNKLLWTGIGCVYLYGCLCVTFDELVSGGTSCSFLSSDPIDFIPISPRPERLLGKSPEYIDFYTNVYKKEVTEFRTQWVLIGAGTGCLTGCIVAVAVSND